MNRPPLLTIALVGSCAFLAGCNTPPAPAETKKASAKEETYVPVNSMGSWIPRKVKKKEDIIGDSGQVASGSALEKIDAHGTVLPPNVRQN
jgi:hypothetical protein